jgi:hypothetical protein
MVYRDTYCIVPVSYLETLDFSTVKDDSMDTVRRSVDGTKAVIFWEGDAPAGIEWQTYTLKQILVIVKGEEWALAVGDGDGLSEEELERLTNEIENDTNNGH